MSKPIENIWIDEYSVQAINETLTAKYYMWVSYDAGFDEKESEDSIPKSIIEFYSLKELLDMEPNCCFDVGGYLVRNKEEKDIGEDYMSPDHLQFLGDTVLLSDEEIDTIPKWAIKRNLGR